ncbi:hypothetical protein [Actinospica robiniae]|uniref:hypothetical protein n=1 Tax=Actinospica robiniae TaxID=304901 RepID=UPI0005566B15|nr:hypothetical protein [Actinospica robiniae]
MRAVRRRFAGALATAVAVSGTVLALPAPAYAAWGVTDTISLQAYGTSGYGVVTDVGSVSGWVQFDDGGNTIQYSLTICRQSGYVWPYLNIGADAIESPQGQWTDTPLTTIDMPQGTPVSTCCGGGDTITGTATATNPWNFNFTLVGGYFDSSTYRFSNVTDSEAIADPYHVP